MPRMQSRQSLQHSWHFFLRQSENEPRETYTISMSSKTTNYTKHSIALLFLLVFWQLDIFKYYIIPLRILSNSDIRQ